MELDAGRGQNTLKVGNKQRHAAKTEGRDGWCGGGVNFGRKKAVSRVTRTRHVIRERAFMNGP